MGSSEIKHVSYFAGEVFVALVGSDTDIKVEEITTPDIGIGLIYSADSLLQAGLSRDAVKYVARVVVAEAKMQVEFRQGGKFLFRVSPRGDFSIKHVRLIDKEVFVTLDGIEEDIVVEEVVDACKTGTSVYSADSLLTAGFCAEGITRVAQMISLVKETAVEFRHETKMVCRVCPGKCGWGTQIEKAGILVDK